jgi:DNA methylase
MPRLSFARYRSKAKYTHYLFRFPAKFHPPVVRCLIDRYTKRGDTILDPFCGSGTLLVEAVLSKRNALGLDVDPVAAFISRVKSTPLSPDTVERDFTRLRDKLSGIRRPDREYDRLMHEDLLASSIRRYRRKLRIPDIPNIGHWFRIYVVLDLARLRCAIECGGFAPRVREFFLACFASVIRNASNADPVPVSGLEVTSHMKRLDKQGRRIDPFELFERRVYREIAGMREFWREALRGGSARVRHAEAIQSTRRLPERSVDVVITSPPYNTAVDYYRRHTLEMYWLDLVGSHQDRLQLAPRYLGRDRVRGSNARLGHHFESDYICRLIAHAERISAARRRAIVHYCASMQLVLENLARALRSKGRAVFVVGNSKWNGQRIRATKLLRELAANCFEVEDTFTYLTRNRYMSYQRHNGADINREFVLVLKKRPAKLRQPPTSIRGNKILRKTSESRVPD